PVMPLPFEDELVDNEPEELSDLAKSAFAWSIDVFGDRVIACLLSKKFKLRESALFEVTRLIDIEKGVGLTIDEKIDKVMLKSVYIKKQKIFLINSNSVLINF